MKYYEKNGLHIAEVPAQDFQVILSAEAYRKFKALGFWDVIKLDGGGSFYFNAGGRKKYTAENRRVCTILDLG